MSNALADTPPAPNPDSTNALMSGSAPIPQGVPPRASGAAGPGGVPQAMPAPPTHAQTVAALRHFDAVRHELDIVLKDPALGKSNMKSKIIDSMTRLVAGRYLKPAQAVDELSKVPSEPLLQMKWAKMMMQQAKMAENAILDHYGMTNPHLGTVAEHAAMPVDSNMDDHGDHLAAMTANYGKANG